MKRVDEARVIKIAEAGATTVVPGSGAVPPSSVTGLQAPSVGAQVNRLLSTTRETYMRVKSLILHPDFQMLL